MCESEAHGLPPESEGPSGVQKLNVSCPEGVGALGNARGSLVSVDSGDGLPNARETPRDDDDDDEAASNASEASNEKSNLQQSSVDKGEPRGVSPPTSQESLVVEDVEAEGVDPFSMKPSDTTDSLLERKPPDRRGSKTVNFKDPEVETPIQNGKSQENVNISSCGSSKGTSGDLLLEDGSPEKCSSNRHRALGEGNPVYRLSLKLSTNLFNMTEIPGANQHREAEKVGYLTKLSSRSFPYISQWKRRYCVLAKGRLYYYEREDSKPGEKSNGVINLEYFDHVAEAGPKDCKKATNVFVITSQDRSFFDPGRHLFSADTLPDMKDWIRRLQSALDQIRNNNRPATSTSLPSKDGGKKGREENLEKKENLQNRENIMPSSNKERKKKKKEESHRSRKSARVGVSSETQTSAVEPISVTSEQEAEVQMMTSPKGGVQLLGLAPHLGVQLPGLSSKEVKPSVISSSENEGKRSSDGNEDLPLSGPTLACVTKNRVKGPQGRRAPQNHRRTLAASTLKKRASSLSALEYQDLNDNSEAAWMNRSLDVLEDGEARSGRGAPKVVGPKPSLPYKAYNYSSDEDDVEDDHSDSFPTSASAMPPPPPPRSASYGLELRHHNPHLGSTERHTLHSSLGDDARGSQGDLGGSKRSLGDVRMYGLAGEWHGSQGEGWVGGSRGSGGEAVGRASPVMDDLDNMLMNQSVQHAMDSTSDVGSEGSTCRAADQLPQQPRPHLHHHHHQGRKKTHDLSRFATAVRHLQRHVVEIDRAVFGITGDVSCTRREVTALKEAVRALQADTDTITSTLSNLTQEAITAQQEITFAAQEAERVQYAANLALRDAEKARQEQQKTRMDYEELVAEVRTALKNLREGEAAAADHSQVHAFAGSSNTNTSSSISFSGSGSEGQQGCKTPDGSAAKLSHEHKATEGGKAGGGQPITHSPKSGRASSGASSTVSSRTSARSSSGSSGAAQVASSTKTSGYQSLFSKSSSIISGLTQRHSLTKSVSFADEKDKEKKKKDGASGKAEGSDKKKKNEAHQNTQESKDVKVDKSHSFLERRSRKDDKYHKEDKKPGATDTSGKDWKNKDKTDSTDRKYTSSLDRKYTSSLDRKYTGSIDRKERKGRRDSSDKKGKGEAMASDPIISQISLEDIPMADDNTQELLDRSRVSKAQLETAVATSSSAVASVKTTLNFSLGKSSSSPTVSYFGPANRPRLLPLSRESRRSEQSTSNPSSPESPSAPCPFPRSASTLSPVNESPVSESTSIFSMHRPGSTPGPLTRQGSMTTVPEDREVDDPPPTKRPGAFAISRQNSSPNIPLQRQNSGPIIPLQRQNSLGVVPEEGRLPRQESLTSVPEERPLADCTLPLSPSQSMTHVPMSPTVSPPPVVSESTRRAARESMELVTGPVLAGSSMQEAAATGTLPVLNLSEENDQPSATSTLKKDQKSHSNDVGILV
ncbi:uncharacterized protein [Panulirus ornatus]|uniref:uncharacterized protein isoform X2 n=1 Tax=Panulirus ornatus TaxID=150431 RepID=UPI003A88104F